jgi:hypothetical protein
MTEDVGNELVVGKYDVELGNKVNFLIGASVFRGK